LRRFALPTPSLHLPISSFWRGSELEILFDICRSFAVDSGKFFSCHSVSMSDDSSKPVSGAVSLCRAFAAQCSWGSVHRASDGYVSESVGIACHWPASRSGNLGSLAFRSVRFRQAPLRRNTDREKILFGYPRKISSLHSGSRVEALAEE
jgi:hypothetical protein